MSLEQGLLLLKQQVCRRDLKVYFDERMVTIPVYSFINQLITSLKGFIKSQQHQCWCGYLLDENLDQKALSNLIKSWERLRQRSLQCNLLISLLANDNKNKVRLYLKTRKLILQTTSNAGMIDQILLSFQDSISIIYKLFQNKSTRRVVTAGIKNIFVAFKTSEAKQTSQIYRIHSSVLIQYLLSVYGSILRLYTQETTFDEQGSFHQSFQKALNSSSVKLHSQIQKFKSDIHEENGLYKKTFSSRTNDKKLQVIDKSFWPLKQTSRLTSLQISNNFTSPSKQSNHQDRQKSSFDPSKQNKTPVQSSDLQRVGSFYKSRGKMQGYNAQIAGRQEKGHPSQIFTNNKQNQFMEFKNENRIAYPPKRMYEKVIYPQNTNTQGKQFTLDGFYKVLFQHSQQEKQSLLRRSRAKLKKVALQKQKQTEENFGSTGRFQIQSHFLNMRRKSVTRENPSVTWKNPVQQKQQNRQRNSHSSQQQSYRQQDFRTIINKNQQFKNTMLKKSQPSNHSKKQSISQIEIKNLQFQSKGDTNQFQMDSDSRQQDLNQVAIYKHNTDQKRISQMNMSIQSMKRDIFQMRTYFRHKNSEKTGESYDDLYQTGGNRHRLSTGVQEQVGFKNNCYNQRNQEDLYHKSQIIHRIITQNQNDGLFEQNIQQISVRIDLNGSNSVIQLNDNVNVAKVKQRMKIDHDYNQNFDETLQLQPNSLQISNSVYKRSKFQPQNNINYNYFMQFGNTCSFYQ